MKAKIYSIIESGVTLLSGKKCLILFYMTQKVKFIKLCVVKDFVENYLCYEKTFKTSTYG